MARTSYTGSADVAAGTTEAVLAVDVERVQSFLLEEVEIRSASSPNGTLEVRVFQGDRPVTPQQGTASLVTDNTELDAETGYARGDEIRVTVENTGASERTVSVVARGISSASVDGGGYTTYLDDER